MKAIEAVLDLVFPVSRDARIVRALDDSAALALLSPVPIAAGGRHGAALTPYRTRDIGALIREAKFRGSGRAYALLALLLDEYLASYLEDRSAYEDRPIALVPVPLSKRRFRERGYNQVDEVLKRSRYRDARMPQALKRVKDTKAQTTLSKEARRENLLQAFTSPPLAGEYLYIVVDDVHTTGATLGAAIQAMEASGARHIVPIALSC